MKQTLSETMFSSLPFDIVLKIALALEVTDVCALGGCSTYLRKLCGSDCLWETLAKQRWPSLSSSSSASDSTGWREIYIRLHKEMAVKANTVIEFLEDATAHDSLEGEGYYKAIQDLYSTQLAFKDIQMFLFKRKLNVMINLVGLHYCIYGLKVPAGNVRDALMHCKISERQVCIRWWRIGRWFFGFHMREEPHSRIISLGDLATDKGELVLKVLRRVHDVLRVEISISDATTTHFSQNSS